MKQFIPLIVICIAYVFSQHAIESSSDADPDYAPFLCVTLPAEAKHLP